MNARAFADYKRDYDYIASIWPAGANDIIRERNPEMYSRMILLQDHLDGLMAKDAHTKDDKKRFKELLAAWKGHGSQILS